MEITVSHSYVKREGWPCRTEACWWYRVAPSYPSSRAWRMTTEEQLIDVQS